MPDQVLRMDSGSKERVAYDLMARIAGAETAGQRSLTRKQTLELYAQCLVAVHGGLEAPPLT